MIVLRGGSVVDAGGSRAADVLVEGDTIKEVGVVPEIEGATLIDARGRIVGPGFVDLHVHFREPGQTWKEDIESGSRAAAAGGYTGVVAMPNTEPALDTPDLVTKVIERANDVGLVTLRVAGALTRAREGTEPADLRGLYKAGVRMFSDDGDSVASAGLLEKIMRTVATLPSAVVSEHAEDRSMTSGGHMHEGEMSARHGVEGLPVEAEDSIVERDIAIAAMTGCPLHIQHVSSAAAVEMIEAAKKAGLRITAEATPHHLDLDESALQSLDPNLKMYPPLRSASDRMAIVEGLGQGTIDAVATDHAPHSREEKSVSFQEAPRGVIGLETAAPIVFAVLGSDPVALFERMSVAPSRIGGFERHGRPTQPGEPANLVLWDPDERWTPDRFESKAANSPFIGRELKGRVKATIHEGVVAYQEEEIDD